MGSFGFGIRFCPTDEEIITYYVKNMAKNQPLPLGSDRVMIERNIYGEKGTPWDLFCDNDPQIPWQTPVDALGKVFLDQKVLYVFTRLSSIGKKGDKNKNRTAGCGQWHGNTAPEDVKKVGSGELIGKKRTFTFKSKEETHGQWTMYEYYIDGDCLDGLNNELDTSLVLCRIKRDDSKSSKGGKLVFRKSSTRYGAVESDDQSGYIPALIADSRGAIEATKRQLEIDQIGSSKKLRISTTDSSNVQELVASNTSTNSSSCVVNSVSGSGSVVNDTLGDIGYVPSCGDDALSVEAYPDLCFDPGELVTLLEHSPLEEREQLDGFQQTTSAAELRDSSEVDGAQIEGFQQIDHGSMIDQMQSVHEEGTPEIIQCLAMKDQEANMATSDQRVDDAFGVREEYPDFNPNLVLGDGIYSIPSDYDMDSRWEQYYSNPNSFSDFDPAALAVHQSVINVN